VIPAKQKPGPAKSSAPLRSVSPTRCAFDDLPTFVGGDDQHLLPILSDAIARAEQIDIVSAFVQPSGLLLIRERLSAALARGARVRLLTGDYLNVTSPDALREMLALMSEQPAFSAWVYSCAGDESFHPKSYIFSRGEEGVAFVGSSNISARALQSGVEWNLRTVVNAPLFRTVRDRFEHLLRAPNVCALTREWIDSYAERARVPPAPEARLRAPDPNPIQKEALAALIQTRAHGARRGLVVMATGLGKTYLAAFDARAMRAKRALFVAHRDEILTQARDAWAAVFPDKVVGILGGGRRERDADVLFASIQTLARAEHLRGFAPDHFDYVVTDEFHHAAASSYRKVLAHFQPKFLLGLTATPDRMDGASLLALCDDNLVYRKDLVGGIAAKLLVPFHYFGVKDGLDFAPIPWRSGKFDVDELTKAVATEERAAQALAAYRQRAETTPRRTLCFCVSVVHADFMADFLRRHGIQAVAVHSGPTSAPRADSLAKLAAGDLEVLCAVDIFNEGLDVPEINAVLMLRPTESPIVFLQQIGRGLRKADQKRHLTIVDFIGNHRSFLQKPQALLSLLGHSLAPYAALKRIREHSLELPEGCSVDVELDALDMLERLCRVGSEDLVVFKYVEFRDAHGRRPTASELHAAQINLSPIRDRDGTWFDFVARQGDLATD
ncbi:MAG: DEAD/DEAH box helicase family protein, partial [Gemmatimonadales bacterium]